MPTLFLEAFGQLTRDMNLPGTVSMEEDLYSVFTAHAGLMGWSTTGTREHPMLWAMNEAELTARSDASRIGWVQVDLGVGPAEPVRVEPPSEPGWAPFPVTRRSVEPAMALPPLIQCFDDALRRFGIVMLSGLQVTASYLDPGTGSCAADLISGLNWFNTASKARADALIVIDDALLGNRAGTELVASLQQLNTGTFEFGPPVAVPQEHAIAVPPEAPADSIPSPAHPGIGLPVTLPEWTASAAAWALAIVIDTARTSGPDARNFTVRMVRIR